MQESVMEVRQKQVEERLKFIRDRKAAKMEEGKTMVAEIVADQAWFEREKMERSEKQKKYREELDEQIRAKHVSSVDAPPCRLTSCSSSPVEEIRIKQRQVYTDRIKSRMDDYD